MKKGPFWGLVGDKVWLLSFSRGVGRRRICSLALSPSRPQKTLFKFFGGVYDQNGKKAFPANLGAEAGVVGSVGRVVGGGCLWLSLLRPAHLIAPKEAGCVITERCVLNGANIRTHLLNGTP